MFWSAKSTSHLNFFFKVQEEAESESEEETVLREEVEEVEEAEDNEDLDGVPLDGAALLKGVLNQQTDDIDGVPSKYFLH